MILKFYRTLQHLSIDIVIGAVTLLHFFSKPFGVSLPWASYVLLASTVWLIYTLDHLKDAKRSASSLRARYKFHLKNERVLKATLVLVAITSAVCLVFLPTSILLLGGLLSILCLIYLIFQSRLAAFGLKEFYVAVMYSLGILISPMALSNSFEPFPVIALLVLAYTNLLLFSWFEIEQDRKDAITSAATVLGASKIQKLVWVLISAGLALGVSGLWQNGIYAGYLSVVLLSFWRILSNPEWASRNERYRTIGDGVFILPLLLELL